MDPGLLETVQTALQFLTPLLGTAATVVSNRRSNPNRQRNEPLRRTSCPCDLPADQRSATAMSGQSHIKPMDTNITVRQVTVVTITQITVEPRGDPSPMTAPFAKQPLTRPGQSMAALSAIPPVLTGWNRRRSTR